MTDEEYFSDESRKYITYIRAVTCVLKDEIEKGLPVSKTLYEKLDELFAKAQEIVENKEFESIFNPYRELL